jgi:hypothetical protein
MNSLFFAAGVHQPCPSYCEGGSWLNILVTKATADAADPAWRHPSRRRIPRPRLLLYHQYHKNLGF